MKCKIRFFSSFGDPNECGKILDRLCETSLMENFGKDREIEITTNDDYTHVIILNTAMPTIPKHIDKKNVIGLAFEPRLFLGLSQPFVDYAKKNIGKYLLGDKYDLQEPFIEHFSYMWYCTPCKTIPFKNKIMSLMISEKGRTFGHLYRHYLAKEILKQGLPVDIYGRGCQYYNKEEDDRLKGEFEELEPYRDYLFHICIENVESNHYFSEKIINPLLNGTTPIYLGCTNIEKYFGTIIKLSKSIERDIDLIKDIIKNPDHYKKEINLDEVKDKVYLLRNLDTIFS